ncbi:hypothetical protein RUM44_002258 [Polyplax serrata]|uniref:Sodium/calcium exchanger membrane region domain-containing protein n=1 Tax=Polyplax serrata TaxID=468196 RepID=A0ABR1AN19_POLSC
MSRRRVGHRDKIFSYVGMLTLYIFINLVLSASKTDPNKTDVQETTEKPPVSATMTTLDLTTTMKPVVTTVENEGTTKSKPATTAVPTWRPKRENCTPPAIEQFPRPLMGPNARRNGGIIIHIFVAVYAFIALAIVCDDYFVSSLDRICEELKLSPDVAGATFMAAGSSAPELATVVIGVFFAKDDIGVSGVIGSAVFNIMFVISAGLVTYKTLNEDKSRRPSYTQSPDKVQFCDLNVSEQEQQANQQQPYPGHVPQGAPQQDYYRPKPAEMTEVSPLIKPTDGGQVALISWYLTVPIHYMCMLTLPDCKSEKYKNWYPFTFVLSMIWISFYSYIMVWMITVCGSTMGIPDTVMGLTFVAAGVSVPDALSSLAVVKEGYGDMAVSNAVGSNVFDILICLGLPWFIQTALIKPGSHVNVISKGLSYSTLSLLSTVVFLLVATHMNGWKLDKKYGVILMVWYILFITFASLYELNVFGNMNPPECPSLY